MSLDNCFQYKNVPINYFNKLDKKRRDLKLIIKIIFNFKNLYEEKTLLHLKTAIIQKLILNI